MVKKLSYEERMLRFRDRFKSDGNFEMNNFLKMYHEFKELETGLLAEKKKQWEQEK